MKIGKFIMLLLLLSIGQFIVAQGKTELKVLQINIWQEGTVVPNGFPAIADEIIDKNADIVLFSEVRNYKGTDYIQRILAELKSKGASYFGKSSDEKLDVGLISKFPVTDQHALYGKDSGMGGVLKSKIRVGKRDFVFYSLHLDYTNYACYLPRGYDGVTWKKMENPITEVSAIVEANRKSKRDEAIRDIIHDVEGEKQSQSFIVAGDFNEPSHLDWTVATKDLFDHRGAVVPWDCSVLLEKAGFKDSFRVQYPNPVSHPGFTYPAFNKDVPIDKLAWAPTADDRDRIDYVYYRSKLPLKVVKARIVGPTETVKYAKKQGKDSEDEFLLPKGIWPTDHKALLVTFTF
ncbi:endonuclease/exonuclease/phosphatase family protein [Sphingobacterium sp. BIGb0165]|uniref:endonuclease/exonuclease/phosphatase family protein n=1 Tax=Sphingobacterium sp. BIGb0165 TaxID=2940615 RepID=UPI002168FB1B|nr:endonuclease/exonuclease/phosphatase family protein [Sphingobacterium sp. BIGb0165]MCS4226014.1 endonuclease/exonuclease/phosphatase family metal-dependent hydrolase [Sphingobacterium sp. BIGb0165]